MRLSRYENCPGSQPITFQLIFNTSANFEDQTQYSGVLDVRKNFSEPLELAIDVMYCGSNTKACKKLPTQVISNVCQHLNDSSVFYVGFLNNVQPKFICPLKAGRYTIPKATVDLSKLSLIPIPASTWIMTMKLFSVGDKKSLVFCAIIEYKIAVAKTRNRQRPLRH